MIIPAISPEIDIWCLPYFSAVGKSSSNEMNTIIPATAAMTILLITGDQNGIRKSQATNAPTGSANPDRDDIQNAFRLLPVAWYMGTETAMPSGMLCMAMAKVIGIATESPPVIAVANVAMPSGKLWMVNDSAIKIPVRCNAFP